MLNKELMALNKNDCEHLVKCYDFFVESRLKGEKDLRFYIVQEFCNGGTLVDYLKIDKN